MSGLIRVPTKERQAGAWAAVGMGRRGHGPPWAWAAGYGPQHKIQKPHYFPRQKGMHHLLGYTTIAARPGGEVSDRP